MEEKLIIAGFGGQGILFSGKLWAELLVQQGHNVTYFPSYGAEVRGGTCNCHVIVSDDEIASPTIEQATSLIVMNQPSLERFAPRLLPDGLAVVNASLADPESLSNCQNVLAPPATEIAKSMGNPQVANVVIMGVYNAYRELVDFEALETALTQNLTDRKKSKLIELNLDALRQGRDWLCGQAQA